MSVTFKNTEGLRWNQAETGIWVKVPELADDKNQFGEVHVPVSGIHDDSEVYRPGDDGTLVVKDWLAEDNGWV